MLFNFLVMIYVACQIFFYIKGIPNAISGFEDAFYFNKSIFMSIKMYITMYYTYGYKIFWKVKKVENWERFFTLFPGMRIIKKYYKKKWKGVNKQKLESIKAILECYFNFLSKPKYKYKYKYK